jgi:hypothetical protein
MKRVRHLIRRLFFRNFKHHYQWAEGDRSELKRIMVTIQYLVSAIVAVSVFALFDGFFGLHNNLICDLLLCGFFILAYHLINLNHLAMGKLIVLIAGNAVLFLNAASQGRNAGNFFLFFPIVTCIFSLFSFRELQYIFISAGITLANFIFLEITDYAYLKTIEFPVSYQYPNYIISFLISTIMIGYFSYYYSKANSITENKLKKINARLKEQNQKLTKTNSELDGFVYKASHDLRAPLTSLLGLIDISRMENDMEKLKEYSQLQEKLIRKLDMYIMDILTISRNTNLEINTEEINFELLIGQSLEQLKYLENYARIEKNIQISEGDGAFFSDQKRISIILNNLLSNAIRYADFTKDKPHVSVRITLAPNEAVVELLDNGIGIDKAHLGKIFKMFYRATDRNSGSGLGLYIVREITEKLHGTIQVTSEPGQWTHFEIRIPNMQHSALVPNAINTALSVEA